MSISGIYPDEGLGGKEKTAARGLQFGVFKRRVPGVVFSAAFSAPPHGAEPQIPKDKGGNMHLLWWIIVGVIAGWATGKIMKGGGYGFWLDLLLGVVGALVGGFIARHLGLAESGGMIYTILVALGGAIIVVFLFRLITRGRG